MFGKSLPVDDKFLESVSDSALTNDLVGLGFSRKDGFAGASAIPKASVLLLAAIANCQLTKAERQLAMVSCYRY